MRARDRRVAAARTGEGFDAFAASFGDEPVPPQTLRAVYGVLQEWMSDAVADFPVRAADDLHTLYGLADEDLEEAVGKMLRRCGRQWPPALGQALAVETVSDLVHVIASGPALEAAVSGPGDAAGKKLLDFRRRVC